MQMNSTFVEHPENSSVRCGSAPQNLEVVFVITIHFRNSLLIKRGSLFSDVKKIFKFAPFPFEYTSSSYFFYFLSTKWRTQQIIPKIMIKLK